ncbi:MAG: hypothetical protein E4H13_04820 [Calditrichales bacterium]|nr:MAG: hypothetical protein E4H13_04820 [Calditrichales bacterium]
MKTMHFIFLFGWMATVFAQEIALAPDQMKADLAVVRDILTNGHPGLYDYTSKTQLDSLYRSIVTEISTPQSPAAFFRLLSGLTDQIHDGHLLLFPPPTLQKVERFFPLLLKYIQGDWYTDTDDFDLPAGTQILSINDIPLDEILERLWKYVPADGFNTTQKYRKIEMYFSLYLNYAFGAALDYSVTYLDQNGQTQRRTVQSEPFESLNTRNTRRRSYFARYHGFEDGRNFSARYIGNKSPFVYFIDSLKTAVLTVHSFGIDPKQFKSDLIDLFEEIEDAEADYLVIDIRRNDGGFRPDAIHLFTFLTNKPFRQIESSQVVSLTIPQQEYVFKTYLDPQQFLYDKFKDYPRGDRWVLATDGAEEIMVPDDRGFKGKVYVLVGGLTFSAAATFALNAKNDPDITLVGEECGGGYYFHNGEFPVYYRLPHSEIVLVQFMEKVLHVVSDKTVPPGSGVPPDYTVGLTADDLFTGKDAQLDYILNQLIPLSSTH